MARGPARALLPPARRPPVLRRPFAYLDETYGLLAKKTVVAGTQRMRLRRAVAKHQGRLVAAGEG
eukprot:8412968-Lingulodinium_polyedra.AAC.1